MKNFLLYFLPLVVLTLGIILIVESPSFRSQSMPIKLIKDKLNILIHKKKISIKEVFVEIPPEKIEKLKKIIKINKSLLTPTPIPKKDKIIQLEIALNDYISAKKFNKALDLLEKLKNLDPNYDIQTKKLLIDKLIKKEKIIQLANEKVKIIKKKYQQGQFKEVINLSKEVLKLMPDNTEALKYYELAKLSLKRKIPPTFTPPPLKKVYTPTKIPTPTNTPIIPFKVFPEIPSNAVADSELKFTIKVSLDKDISKIVLYYRIIKSRNKKKLPHWNFIEFNKSGEKKYVCILPPSKLKKGILFYRIEIIDKKGDLKISPLSGQIEIQQPQSIDISF